MSPEEHVRWERERRRGYAGYVIWWPLLGALFLSYVPGLVTVGILGNRNGWSDFIEVHAIKAVLIFMIFWYIRNRQWNRKEAEYLTSDGNTQEGRH